MNLWFRLYTELLNNPKVQGLPAELFRIWINVLCVAKVTDGILPPLAELAFRLRVSERVMARAIADLMQRRLIDETEPGRYQPHDWAEHQYASDSSTERVRKHRAKLASNAKGNVSATPQIQSRAETETETDTEQTSPPVRAPRVADLDGQPSDRFDELWQRWPRKTERDRAARNWISYVTVANETAVMACADRYLNSDEVSRGVVCNFHTWLERQHRGGWADEWPRARERPAAPQGREQRRQADIDRSWEDITNSGQGVANGTR